MSHKAQPLPRPDLPDFDRFAARLAATGSCTKSTGRTYAARARAAVDWCTVNKPGVPLLELSAEQLEDYIIHLNEQGLSSSSRRTAVYALRRFYGYLGKDVPGFDNPAEKVDAPTQKSRQPEPYGRQELARLLAAARQAAETAPAGSKRQLRARFDYAVLATFRYTGLRLSELLELNIDDIQLRSKRLEVRHGKGDKQRFIPLPAVLVQILADYLAEVRPHCPPSPRLFANPSGYPGSAVYGQLAKRAAFAIVIKYATAADLDGPHFPHRLRHAYGSDLFHRRVPLNVISRLLGHQSVQQTIRYLKLTDGDLAPYVDGAFSLDAVALDEDDSDDGTAPVAA